MADANLKAQPRKPRKARQPEYEHRSGILRNTPDPGPMAPDGQPHFPWMEIADRWLPPGSNPVTTSASVLTTVTPN
jgi:hypothetical protein